jgi:hypothetical protein
MSGRCVKIARRTGWESRCAACASRCIERLVLNRSQALTPTVAPRSQHRMGLALVAAAAVAWSTAPFFTRLLPFDSWTILCWRGRFGGGFVAAFLVLTQGRAGLVGLISMGKHEWLVASLSMIGMVSFIPARS